MSSSSSSSLRELAGNKLGSDNLLLALVISSSLPSCSKPVKNSNSCFVRVALRKSSTILNSLRAAWETLLTSLKVIGVCIIPFIE